MYISEFLCGVGALPSQKGIDLRGGTTWFIQINI